MNTREYFNEVAYKWDRMCSHDGEKIKKIIELSSVKENSKILDVGTGTGILISYLLKTLPREIIGIDISENMIEVAKGKYNDSRVKFIAKDIMEYYVQGYDYIFLYSAYPHFDDKDLLLRHLSNLTAEGGKLIIAHSQSREKINEVHKNCSSVCNDVLQPAELTAGLMSKYYKVDRIIDNDEMYYVSGIK